MQETNALQVIASEQGDKPAAPAAAEEFLFTRDELSQQLLKIATHQLVHERNEAAAHSLCTAAYLAQLPRSQSDRQYSGIEEFWWSFKMIASTSASGSPRGGASA